MDKRPWWRALGRSAEPRAVLGQHVADLRRARGLDQSAIARRLTELGIPARQNTISRIENATRPVDVDELVALAHVLGLDHRVEQLLSDPALVSDEVFDRSALVLRTRIDELQRVIDLLQRDLDIERANYEDAEKRRQQKRGGRRGKPGSKS